MTTKVDPKTKQAPKSRGIAFLELPSSAAMQACLKLHHSLIQGRRINVELTAGGGGKSESRQEKIKTRNDRVGGQRERRAEREKEAEAAEAGMHGGDAESGPRRQRGSKRKHDDEAPTGAEGSSRPVHAGDREVEVVRADGEITNADGSTTKIRGGRRVKAKVVSDPTLMLFTLSLTYSPASLMVNETRSGHAMTAADKVAREGMASAEVEEAGAAHTVVEVPVVREADIKTEMADEASVRSGSRPARTPYRSARSLRGGGANGRRNG